MYMKRKNVVEKACDKDLLQICSDLLDANRRGIFGISKKFVLNEQNEIDKEIIGKSIILSTIPVENLIIPSPYRLIGTNNIAYWFDDNILVELIYMQMKFTDGRKVKNLFLDLDEPKLKENKAYRKN